jgi:hypothetical protein
LVFGDGPSTTHLNFTELALANTQTTGPTNEEIHWRMLFCNVLEACKTKDGVYETASTRKEKTEVGLVMQDVMWCLKLAPPVKHPANIRVVLTRYAAGPRSISMSKISMRSTLCRRARKSGCGMTQITPKSIITLII